MKKKFTLLLAVLLAGFGFSAMAAVGDVFTSGGYSFKVIAEGDVNEVEFTAPATAYDLSAKTGSITMPTSVTNDGVTYSVVGIGDEAFKNAKFPTAIGILNFDRPLRYIGDYAFQGATSGGAPGKSDSHVRNIRFYCDDMTTVSPTAFVENRIIGSFLAAKRGETSDFVNKACTINYGSSNSGSLGNFCQVVDGSIILLGIGNQGNIATSSAGYVANKITINSEITVIGENAMYGNDKFTQIDLGAVEAVQAHAFKNCVFETVTIPATCTTIASDAFEGCTAIATITCNAATPPAGVVFDDAVYARISESGNITVPDEALEAYKADANWGKFWAAPAPTTYTITVADDIVNGTVEVDKAEAEEGETVTVTATPIDRSYQLKSITVTPETLNLVVEVDENGQFVMPADNVTVTAEFELIPPVESVVTFTAEQENGSMAVTVDGAPVASGATIAEGATVTVVLTPAEGYKVASFTVETVDEPAPGLRRASVPVTDEGENTYSFQMPGAPITMNAEFTENIITAITDLNAAAGQVTYVNVMGQTANRPFNGVNIVMQGGKAIGKLVK